MAGQRVDRFDLASVALRGAGVEQADRAQPLVELVARRNVLPVAGRAPALPAGTWAPTGSADGRPRSTPRFHRRAPRPRPCGRGCRASTTAAPRSCRRRRRRRRRNDWRRYRARTCAAQTRQARAGDAGPAPPAVGIGQILVEVDEDRARNVAGLVRRPPCTGLPRYQRTSATRMRSPPALRRLANCRPGPAPYPVSMPQAGILDRRAARAAPLRSRRSRAIDLAPA